MPDVSFAIAGRTYTLRCAEGQEEHLIEMAGALDARVAPLAELTPGADDRRLLVVAALGILDESHAPEGEAGHDARIAELEAENATLRAWAGDLGKRLEVLAAGLEQAVETAEEPTDDPTGNPLQPASRSLAERPSTD